MNNEQILRGTIGLLSVSYTASCPWFDEVIACDVLNKIRDMEISESNGNFQRLIVNKIFDTGKNIDDLTVRELRKLIIEAGREFRYN